jgi:hypothetical protein
LPNSVTTALAICSISFSNLLNGILIRYLINSFGLTVKNVPQSSILALAFFFSEAEAEDNVPLPLLEPLAVVPLEEEALIAEEPELDGPSA